MTTMQTPDTATRFPEAAILADEHVPAIHIWRDFDATPAQLFRAHTDPEVFAQWIGPTDVWTGADSMRLRIRSAISRAPSASVDGRQRTNSSPPYRPTRSVSRAASFSTCATYLRTSSPAPWPCVSFTFLKWSTSVTTTASGRP